MYPGPRGNVTRRELLRRTAVLVGAVVIAPVAHGVSTALADPIDDPECSLSRLDCWLVAVWWEGDCRYEMYECIDRYTNKFCGGAIFHFDEMCGGVCG